MTYDEFQIAMLCAVVSAAFFVMLHSRSPLRGSKRSTKSIVAYQVCQLEQVGAAHQIYADVKGDLTAFYARIMSQYSIGRAAARLYYIRAHNAYNYNRLHSRPNTKQLMLPL